MKMFRAALAGACLLLGGGSGEANAAMSIERVVTPRGIEAWLIRDRLIPAVAIEFGFRGGGALDPAGLEGLADMAADMLTEGAGEIDSSTFQSEIEDRAIGMGFDAGPDAIQGSLKTLTIHRDRAVELLRLALTAPRVEERDLERVRGQRLADLARRAEDPNTISRLKFMATAFPDHPYGRPTRGTAESVKRITRDDVRGFLGRRLARDTLIVGAVGDIAPGELAALIDRAFGDLPAVSDPVATPEVEPQGAGRTIVERRAVPQSVILFGHKGVKRDDPDYYAATLVNYVLGGGGFNSRLTTEVREKRGLAYSVYSSLSPYDKSALIIGSVGTQNARVRESFDLIRAEWKRMGAEGPTETELADAKTYLTGSFALSLDSISRIARTLVAIQYDKLGIDFLERRNGLIEAVTVADARRVARRLFDADRLLSVIVGDPEGVTPSGG